MRLAFQPLQLFFKLFAFFFSSLRVRACCCHHTHTYTLLVSVSVYEAFSIHNQLIFGCCSYSFNINIDTALNGLRIFFICVSVYMYSCVFLSVWLSLVLFLSISASFLLLLMLLFCFYARGKVFVCICFKYSPLPSFQPNSIHFMCKKNRLLQNIFRQKETFLHSYRISNSKLLVKVQSKFFLLSLLKSEDFNCICILEHTLRKKDQ